MIIRILGEGQWRIDDGAVPDLNRLDDSVERAVRVGDQAQLTAALRSLLQEVRSRGQELPDDELADSDLILPDADATVEDVLNLLSGSTEGLIPG